MSKKKKKNKKNRETVCVIDGYEVNKRQLAAVEKMVESGSVKKVCEATGYSRTTIYRFQSMNWWNELIGLKIAHHQDMLHSGLADRVPKMLGAVDKILDQEFDAGLANPAMKAMDIFTKLGRKRGNVITSPLQHSGRDRYIDTPEAEEKTVHNYTMIVNIIGEKGSQEEMLEFGKTGDIPERLLPFVKDFIKREDFGEDEIVDAEIIKEE